MKDQLRVWQVIETNIDFALEHLAGLPEGATSTECHGNATPTPARGRRASASRCPPRITALSEAPRGHVRLQLSCARVSEPRCRRSELSDPGHEPKLAANRLRCDACSWASSPEERSPTRSLRRHERSHGEIGDDAGRPVAWGLAAVDAALKRAGAAPADVETFAHGTTVGTNALLTDRGAPRPLLRPGLRRLLGSDARPAGAVPPCIPSRARWGPNFIEATERVGTRGRIQALGEDEPRGSRKLAAGRAPRRSPSACFLLPRPRATNSRSRPDPRGASRSPRSVSTRSCRNFASSSAAPPPSSTPTSPRCSRPT